MKIHTKDFLADELLKSGLTEMSEKARSGWYHDFLSPLPTPCLQLASDLLAVGTPGALALRSRHMNGEFDASNNESEAWASSPEGRDAFQMLVNGSKS